MFKYILFYLPLLALLSFSLSACSRSGSESSSTPVNKKEAVTKGGEAGPSTQYEVPVVKLDNVKSSDCFGPAEANRLEMYIGFADAPCVRKILEGGLVNLNQPMVDVFEHVGGLPLEKALSESSMFFAEAKGGAAVIPALLLSFGADPNAKVGQKTMLELAFELKEEKYAAAAHYLVENAKTNLNLAGSSGTPLEYAISLKRPALISHLIHRGVDVNLVTLNEGINPLLSAILNGLAASAVQLVDAGAKVDAVDWNGQTALHRAIALEMKPLVGRLLAHKVPVNIQDKDGETALHLASAKGDVEDVKLLIQSGAALELKNSQGKSPLFVAVLREQSAVMDVLLTSNADVKTTDGQQDGLVQVARSEPLALRLLDAGAPVEQVSQSGETALSAHVWMKHLEVVMRLIQKGANAGWSDSQGRGLLHLAVTVDSIPVVKYLLSLKRSDLSLEKADIAGNTPIFKLVSLEMLALLTEFHVNLNRLNSASLPPLAYWVQDGASKTNLGMAKAFLDRGADAKWGLEKKTSYLILLYKGAGSRTDELVEMTRLLLERGVNPLIVSNTGNTFAHYAFLNRWVLTEDVLMPLCHLLHGQTDLLGALNHENKTPKKVLNDSYDLRYSEYWIALQEVRGNPEKTELVKQLYEPGLARLKGAMDLL